MTPAEARTQLQKALDAALPQCFVPVSAQALQWALGEIYLIDEMNVMLKEMLLEKAE